MPKEPIRKHPSTWRRRQFALTIKENGVPTMRPCDRCISLAKECIISRDADACADCVESHASCSLYVSAADWTEAHKETERLSSELEESIRQESAAAKRSARIRKRLATIERRKREMYAHEMRNITELEEDERQNDSSLPSSFPAPDDSWLDPSNFDFEILQATPQHGGDAPVVPRYCPHDCTLST